MTRTLVTLILVLASSLQTGTLLAEQPAERPESNRQETGTGEFPTEDTAGETTAAEEAEQVAQKDETDDGTALATSAQSHFELFIPSEEVSADNAVPFPVDI